MAHFAEVDADNFVLRVLVVSDDQENRGQEFLAKDLALGGVWLQTSYNGNLRKNFAGIGFKYDETLDAFIGPQCHDEAILDEVTAKWNCENGDHDVKLSPK